MDISLHHQTVSICQHKQFARESCDKSLAAEQLSKTVKKPKFSLSDKVGSAKQGLPIKEEYKQSFTDELFTTIKISPSNAP